MITKKGEFGSNIRHRSRRRLSTIQSVVVRIFILLFKFIGREKSSIPSNNWMDLGVYLDNVYLNSCNFLDLLVDMLGGICIILQITRNFKWMNISRGVHQFKTRHSCFGFQIFQNRAWGSVPTCLFYITYWIFLLQYGVLDHQHCVIYHLCNG